MLLAILTRWRRGGSSVWTLIQEQGWVWVVTAAVLVWVLPRLEVVGPTGEPLGIAVRGYGLFLMLAAVASIGLAAWRSERAGIGAEAILRMYPWTFAGGLIGARLFYVIQYFDDFQRETIGQTLLAMAALTQGGLVVYGVHFCRTDVRPDGMSDARVLFRRPRGCQRLVDHPFSAGQSGVSTTVADRRTDRVGGGAGGACGGESTTGAKKLGRPAGPNG